MSCSPSPATGRRHPDARPGATSFPLLPGEVGPRSTTPSCRCPVGSRSTTWSSSVFGDLELGRSAMVSYAATLLPQVSHRSQSWWRRPSVSGFPSRGRSSSRRDELHPCAWLRNSGRYRRCQPSAPTCRPASTTTASVPGGHGLQLGGQYPLPSAQPALLWHWASRQDRQCITAPRSSAVRRFGAGT